MSSFYAGADSTPSFEDLYRIELQKRGIAYKDAPIINGSITLKNTWVKDHALAAGKAAVMTLPALAKPFVDASRKILEKAPGLLDIVPILAIGVAAYLIFAGKSGVNLMRGTR